MHKGVILSVLASCLFGVMYYYTSLLSPLSGLEIFGWRMLLTLPCATVFLLSSGDWHLVRGLWARLVEKPALLAGLILSSLMMGAQLLLFMWAPLHGRSLQVSLGYFLLPLTLVLTGRLVYGERMSRAQKLAAVLALIGVLHELVRVGSFSWETLVVALGYPVYFILRKRLDTDHLGGLWFDMLLLIPLSVLFIVTGHPQAVSDTPRLYLLIPLLGLISASALVAYILASRLLPLSLFGLLSYVEPVLLVAAALLLGESISRDEWFTYLPIWLAVLVLVGEGVRHVRRLRLKSV